MKGSALNNKRKHVATGNPRGGFREGAGRPVGSKDTVPKGFKKASKIARFRAPEGTPEDVANIADKAFRRILRIMNGKIDYQSAGPQLKAACVVREEICGSIKQTIEHQGKNGGPVEIFLTDEERKNRVLEILNEAAKRTNSASESDKGGETEN